jgi:hypothetical protein
VSAVEPDCLKHVAFQRGLGVRRFKYGLLHGRVREQRLCVEQGVALDATRLRAPPMERAGMGQLAPIHQP